MKQYLLIIKGAGVRASSPEEMQKSLQDYMAWAGKIGDHYVDGQRLELEGALLEGDKISTDGPFLEAKEVIAGFIIINAKDQAQANEIAKDCPLLEHCGIEVRAILTPPTN